MRKRGNSTRELLGIRHFTQNGLRTDHGEIVFFRVQPTNLSVLSGEAVAEKVRRLTQLLSVRPELEIFCADARENYEQVKLALREKAERETNPGIRQLLQRDERFLDDIQTKTSTAREFYLCCRVGSGSDEQIFAAMNRLEKQINDQEFDCRRAGKEGMKRILSRYFDSNSEESPEDLDGENAIRRWFVPENRNNLK